MPRITRSSNSWMIMVGLCGLAGGMGAWGCGDDTSGSGGAGSTSTTATTTATSTSASGTTTSTSGTTTSSTTTTTTTTTTTSSGMTPVSVTFTVDTTTMADGMNALAEVLPTEQVFMVGSFNDWNPQDPNYALTADAGSPGLFSITLSFPLDTPGGMLDVGGMMEYKFAKTTDGGDPWGNGMKNYFLIDDVHTCPNFPEATAGLFETGNLTLTIPDVDTEMSTVVVDAWRNYAESFGYNSCN